MWKKRIHTVVWVLLSGCTIMVLVAAMSKHNGRSCQNISVEYEGITAKKFISESDVLDMLKKNGAEAGEDISSFPIEGLEKELEKNQWIVNADLFFDKKMILHVKITEPQPVARVFTSGGESFYIDSTATILPLPEKVSMRLPVFTRIPDKKSKRFDSTLKDLAMLSSFIHSDSFWQHQIAQIDLTETGNYEIIPVVGNQLLRIGTTEDMGEKFSKLKLFYTGIWSKTGFEKYSVVDVRFKDQVVATKRSGVAPKADSVAVETVAETQPVLEIKTEISKAAPLTKKDRKKERVEPKSKSGTGAPKKTIIKKEDEQIKNELKDDQPDSVKQPKAVMPKREKE